MFAVAHTVETVFRSFVPSFPRSIALPSSVNTKDAGGFYRKKHDDVFPKHLFAFVLYFCGSQCLDGLGL